MKICIIEDSKSLLYTLKRLLIEDKYIVRGFEDPLEAIKTVSTEDFDLYIVDINLPNLNGYDTCIKIREYHPDAPIMILTVRDKLDDKIKGFEAGADDYLTKPFEPPELLARVKALLRRKQTDHNQTISIGYVVIDVDDKVVKVKDEEIRLSVTEFQILEYLARNQGRTLGKDRIASMIWEDPYEMSSNLVAIYIGKLRKKLEDTTGEPMIQTIRGFGYRLG